jgi:hypothetical protein
VFSGIIIIIIIIITTTTTQGDKNNSNFGQTTGIKRNWIQHVKRMPRNRLPRVMKHYCPTGRRNHGRPLKRLLAT